jgi:hypothetical protein
LEEPDDAIVFELFANGTHENRAHLTSGRRSTAQKPAEKRPIIDRLAANCIAVVTCDRATFVTLFLTWMSFPMRMMQ